MGSVGVRELRQHTSEVLRRVRDGEEEVEITFRGRVVARLVPVRRSVRRRAGRAVWSDLDALAREIGRRWPKGVGAARAVAEGRRG